MGLSQAISAALSGLKVTQTNMTLVADNVANANTIGYIRKVPVQVETSSNGGSLGARTIGIDRDLDAFVQYQLRSELAGGAYTNVIADYYSQISRVYGEPGGQNALDTLFNDFTTVLQALSTSPEDVTARYNVINQAQVLAQHLNAMSGDIQLLRSGAEAQINEAVNRINELLQNIEKVSVSIMSSTPGGPDSVALLDQRDRDINELAGLIDIRILKLDNNQLSIFTTAGVGLFDRMASRLSFDARTSIGPQSLWDPDISQSGVGTVHLTTANGNQVDLIDLKAIRSGSLAAYLEMRDETLVQAQAQLDQIASAIALVLSNRTVDSAPAVSGAQTGFDLDISAIQDGNSISLTYTDNVTSTQHKVTIIRVDDAAALPLDSSVTPDPDDEVIGIDFSGGIASVVVQLTAALGATGLVFSNPAGSTLRVLDDGAPDLVNVDVLNATVTTDTFTSGDTTLPFFLDSADPGLLYTNRITAGGMQELGFSARIIVNPSLIADPSRLVVYSSLPPTAAGDPTRPDFLHQQLTAARWLFSPSSGIGSANTPFPGSIGDFVRQTISMQGTAANNADRLREGQDIVVNALRVRFDNRSSVNVDTEMANLLVLQNAYGANARVLSAVKQMYEMLLNL